jgi:hypothetical protein
MHGWRNKERTTIVILGALWLPWAALMGQGGAPAEICIVDCPPGANVYLDGNWIGTAGPDGIFRITDLAPGTYHLRIAMSGRADHRTAATIGAGQAFQLSLKPGAPASPPPPIVRKRPASENPSPHVPAVSTATQADIAPAPSTLSPPPDRADHPGNPVLPRQNVPPPIENAWVLPLLQTLGGILLAVCLFFAINRLVRRSRRAGEVHSDKPPDAPAEAICGSIPIDTEEPAGEPEFLERLRFKEALFRDGFRTPKKIGENEMILDIDSYKVGKDL